MNTERNTLLIPVVVLWLAISSHGWQNGDYKQNKHRQQKGDYNKGSTQPSRYINILSFGAVGDGISDDSKAVLAAWKEACEVYGATIEIPAGYSFVLRPLTLQGPCMPHLVLQINGTLLAPPNPYSWSKSSLYQWINLKWLSNFTIQGSGTLDGQGSPWWSLSPTPCSTKKETKHVLPEMRPTIVRFYKSCNVTVRDIHIINSPLCHLKFDNSRGVNVRNITISSPKDSPNTDGIHLQNTRDVEIKHSNIGCGDDCVSIQTGCSNIHIHHLECSPSHGISLGGLGKGSSLACVSNITVDNIKVQNALSGARIKTWQVTNQILIINSSANELYPRLCQQGGIGSVRNVTFSNIQVSNVEIPIVVDQYYCNKRSCKNKTNAVAISSITYRGISGTYSYQPVHLACSDSLPCIDLSLINVRLSPIYNLGSIQKPFCWKSYGEVQGLVEPLNVACLQSNGKQIRVQTKSYNYTC